MVGLRLIAARQGGLPGVPLDPNARELTIGGQAFRVADEPGLTYDLNVGDREAVVQSVREADKAADLVVFSIHAHETASGYSEDPKPADFLPPLFHKLVDAGADIIVRHGPHALQGVEIYKGKPIFYGLASLFFQVGDKTRRFGRGASSWRMPDEWYDSAVAVSEFRNGKVSVIRIYPLIISFEDDRMPGTPRIASPKDARRILGQVKRASAQFGTVVSIENNVGVIRVSSAR